jgi:putative endonuclease
MFYVYILFSLKDKKLYKGFTADIAKRLLRHNRGGNASTAKRKPFVLIHLEAFVLKEKALERERYLKTPAGGVALKAFLINQKILSEDGALNTG